MGDCRDSLVASVYEAMIRKRYSPYALFRRLSVARKTSSRLIQPERYATSSGHAIFSPCRARVGAAQRFGEAVTIEDVVAENEAARIVADELGADQKCLRQTARLRLLGVAEANPPLRAVAK